MMLSTIDIALRGATVALLLVLAASLFRGFGTVLAGRLAAAFALGSAAHAVTASIGATSPVAAAHAPVIALSTGNVVVFWLFTRALFDETFRLRWWHALIWAAVVAFSFVNCMWLAPASGVRAVHHRGQSAGARLYRPGRRADHRVLVVGSRRGPSPRPRLHRQRRGAVWRPERGAADIAVRQRCRRDRQRREFGGAWPPWWRRSRLR